jgi:hypothetical protein
MNNPYSPPSALPYPYSPAPTADAPAARVSEHAIELLRQTRPWAMVISVLCFLGSGVMLIVSAAVVIGSAVAKSGVAFQSAFGLFYVPFAGLYVYPGIKLWAYANAIARLTISRSSVDLVAALRQQKSFWKYFGIAALVGIVVYFVGIVALLAIWQFLTPTKH